MKSRQNSGRKIVHVIMVAALLTAFMMPVSKRALAIGMTIPIGGKVTETSICICTLSTKVVVDGPNGGTFIKSWFSFLTKVYKYNKVEQDKNVLGIASQIRYKCQTIGLSTLLTGKCEDKGTYPLITKIGTSN